MRYVLCHTEEAPLQLKAILEKHEALHLYDDYESLLFYASQMEPQGYLDLVAKIPGAYQCALLTVLIGGNGVATWLDSEEFICVC